MMQTIEANWVAFAVALLAVLVVGWLLLARARSKPAQGAGGRDFSGRDGSGRDCPAGA